MFLSELKLWNFRKYGSGNFDLSTPNLIVSFNRGLNILIGENDSGKTAILDAIKLVLKTHAFEWIKVALKMMYVGFSRPTHLLCFAVLKENVKDDIQKLENAGWEKVDITQTV